MDYSSVVIRLIALFGCLGVTILITAIGDFLRFLTLHLRVFYRMAARIYHFQLLQ